MATTRESLIRFLEDRGGLATGTVKDDTLLFSSSLLDSFTVVDLVVQLETENGISLGAGDVNLDNLDSVERILKFVGSRKKG